MAHFAELDNNNKVIAIHVVANNELLDNGVELEQKGKQFLWNFFNDITKKFVQTSYNANFRKKYASVGDTYDNNRDAFISPKVYESFIFNEESCSWVPPKPKPAFEEGSSWVWDEVVKDWFKLTIPSA